MAGTANLPSGFGQDHGFRLKRVRGNRSVVNTENDGNNATLLNARLAKGKLDTYYKVKKGTSEMRLIQPEGKYAGQLNTPFPYEPVAIKRETARTGTTYLPTYYLPDV